MRSLRRAVCLLTALLLTAVACSTDSGAGGSAAPPSSATADESETAPYPDPEWETTTPEAIGLDPATFDELHEYLEGTNSNCTVTVKDGRIVDEAYWNDTAAETPQEIFSASKSVTSLLVGIAQDQGLLDIDDPASDYITEWQGTPSEDVTIRNLLSNDSGRYWDFRTDYLEMAAGARDKTQFAIDLGQAAEPGERWVYNNAAIQTLERVLEVATGQPVPDFAAEHLFGPIGAEASVSTDPEGNGLMFMGTRSSCRDLARFGYLALREGAWAGEQIVSAEYVAQATSPSQDLNTPYGFLWWLNEDGRRQGLGTGGAGVVDDGTFNWPDAPEDAFAALGLGDQIALVVPSEDLVFVRLGPFRSEDRRGRTSPDEIAAILFG